ncbi:lasso RiPP family leader peptide-containing protein [Nocardiopsis synnemataformans]
MKKYTSPSLTRIGSFKKLTKSLGRLNCNDILGYRALWTTTPGC